MPKMLCLFRWTLVILHLLRMRRNVNRNVFNARKNVARQRQYWSSLPYPWHIPFTNSSFKRRLNEIAHELPGRPQAKW